MKFILLIVASTLVGCAFDSVGVGASYTDQSGRSYGGNVNLHIRDSKTVKRPSYAK